MLNLFVGVMFYNFSKVQEQETGTFGGVVATEDQLNWIEMMKMVRRAEPDYNSRTTPNKDSWRSGVHSFITSTVFEVTIAVIILLNLLLMTLYYEEASLAYTQDLDYFNYAFTGMFTIELVLKFVGFGCSFWIDTWNIFDFIIVICSYIDIIFTSITVNQSLKMLRLGPQILRVLRVLRVARLLRLMKAYKRLQEIMEIIQLCLPSILNIFALLTLVTFIYAILGCYLFYDVTTGTVVTSMYNFSNVALAMMLLLKLSTGEDWNLFMMDCARTTSNCALGLGCGKYYSFFYFISYKIVVTFTMLNLFILVVLQLFDKYFLDTENVMNTFKEELEIFQHDWQLTKPSHLGSFIPISKLRRFFLTVGLPLDLDTSDINTLSVQILKLQIRR